MDAKRSVHAATSRKRMPQPFWGPQEVTMTQRINAMQQSPELFRKFVEFSMLEKSSAIEQKILDLVHIRASQINGCGFCLDMHVKEAKLHGERELRLHHLPIWRESTLFSPRERAALSDKELSDLSFSVMAINAWNRLNVGFRTVPGSADKAYGLDKAGLE
jgi:AhpD family alkylhydroperoxidase